MTRHTRYSIRELAVAGLVVFLSATANAQVPTPEPVTDQETEIGKAMYDQLRAKGEIIESSPLYDSLKPIAEAISRVAQSRYPHPFKFYLVHETQPNAFATPGGNVYVVDSLLHFVKNTEQLAGTLCHEVSHTLHRDSITLAKKNKHIEEREVVGAILLGPTKAQLLAIYLLGHLHSLGYSRDAESKADVTGSDTCAEAGYNPWGLVWLFRDFQNANMKTPPQLLSDHPANNTRVTTLEKHFKDNPTTFSKFDPDPKSATPFSVPADAPAVFLPPAPPAPKADNRYRLRWTRRRAAVRRRGYCRWVADDKGYTLSLSEPALEQEVRTAPHLFLELECDRPLAGPARWCLAGLDRVRLGRGASRQSRTGSRVLAIEVPDGWMSVEHLELLHRDRRWVAHDLGSKNKLILDGRRVDEAELTDGVLLQLGHTFFRFRTEVRAVGPASLDLENVPGGIGSVSTLSSSFQLVLDRAAAVAPGRMAVLLVGESGTGKEVLARSIHSNSGRKGPLVAVNCGAIPPTLVEAELFGHKKGAFTGAGQERVGWVRASDRGTLFLDEIGDLPLAAQASLLRVIQEAEVVPVGAHRPEPLDLRVIAATHRDLDEMVRGGSFRHDLLARLDGITLRLPPLRDRTGDIPLLLVVLLRRLTSDRPDLRLTPAAAQAVLGYEWPLNVRQLEQALTRALSLSGTGPIERAHLPEAVVRGVEPQPLPELDASESRHREELLKLLRQHEGNITAVAKALGKGRTQVIRWIKRYGIDTKRLRP